MINLSNSFVGVPNRSMGEGLPAEAEWPWSSCVTEKPTATERELMDGASRKGSSGSSPCPSALGGGAGPVSSPNSCSLCYKAEEVWPQPREQGFYFFSLWPLLTFSITSPLLALGGNVSFRRKLTQLEVLQAWTTGQEMKGKGKWERSSSSVQAKSQVTHKTPGLIH